MYSRGPTWGVMESTEAWRYDVQIFWAQWPSQKLWGGHWKSTNRHNLPLSKSTSCCYGICYLEMLRNPSRLVWVGQNTLLALLSRSLRCITVSLLLGIKHLTTHCPAQKHIFHTISLFAVASAALSHSHFLYCIKMSRLPPERAPWEQHCTFFAGPLWSPKEMCPRSSKKQCLSEDKSTKHGQLLYQWEIQDPKMEVPLI